MQTENRFLNDLGKLATGAARACWYKSMRRFHRHKC